MMDGKDDAFAALVAYRKWCSDWVKWGTGKSLLVSMPFQVPYEAWEGMSDVNSSLYDEVHDLLSEKGEVGLRSMINKYFRSYFELLKLKEDGKVADVNAVEGLRTGNTFLQNVSDIALGYGVDAGGIASWGSMTQGGGGHGASSVRNIQGCQTGNNQSRCGLDDGLCNSDKSQQVENQRKRSRPKKTFRDLMIDDTDGSKFGKVQILMKGRKGKSAALVILSCVLKGWMEMPKFKQVQDEFGDVGARQGFTKYLKKESFTYEEIEGAMRNLESR